MSRPLREEHHVRVIGADILARQVVEPGTRGYKKILQAFGEEVILQDGSGKIDRKKLGEIVFGDEGRRRVLNGIVHPEVRWEMLKVMRCWWRGEAWVVLDVPLLIESGIHRWVGEVVVVYWCVMPLLVGGSADSDSPEQEQLKRLMSRDWHGGSTGPDGSANGNRGEEGVRGAAAAGGCVKASRPSQLLDIQ